jgi:SAM-dependent methyltransferase
MNALKIINFARNAKTVSRSKAQSMSTNSVGWILTELSLIAIPIFVICVTVFFNPAPSKGFFATIVSKPEWYFISLVFCIEAVRDNYRIDRKMRSEEESAHILYAIFFTVIAAVSSGLATHATLGAAQINSDASSQALHVIVNSTPAVNLASGAATKPVQMLGLFSIPIFFCSAFWSAYSKQKLKQIERDEREDSDILSKSGRPRIYSVYRPGRVRDFYDVVADAYNSRNTKTKGIRDAQEIIIKAIRLRVQALKKGKTLNVLDIGGGTGYGVYHSLRSEERVFWTSLDISPKMKGKFSEVFEGKTAITGDCLDFSTFTPLLSGKKYDIVVLSFALTSMARNIDFAELRKICNPGSIVLVADIHPGYVSKSACFDIDVGGQTHKLVLRKVDPLVLEGEALLAGMKRADWKIFENERSEVYSFFLSFTT